MSEGSLRFSTDDGQVSHIFTDDGRLEVYAWSRWGTVCDDSFGGTEADLACRQLGFHSSTGYGSAGDTM